MFKWLGENKKIFYDIENHMKFKFWCPQIKFYWNTAMSIIYSCHRDLRSTKFKIFTIWPFTENGC